jgi:hypothetical protein
VNSALYLGRVAHTRHIDVERRFDYRSWWLLADLDELDRMDAVPGVGVDRAAPVSFHSRDHGPRDGSSLRAWIDARCAEAGAPLDGGAVRILAHPRVLGYVFNPLSVWYCHGPEGDLRAVCYEVSNTWREVHSHLAVVEPRAQAGLVRHDFEKRLFVSPLMDTDHRYTFRTAPPADRAVVASRQVTADGRLALTASLRAERVELDGRGVARAFAWAPHATAMTMGRIHLQAWKLWRAGGPYRRRGAPPTEPVTIERREGAEVR